MPFHFNLRVDIYRETHTDDVYGGAVILTGSLLYANEPSRMDYVIPRQWLTRNQGLETQKTYSFFFHTNQQHPVWLNEDDYVEIVFPPQHPQYKKRFRIVGVSFESNHPSDARGVIEVTAQRVEETRGNDY